MSTEQHRQYRTLIVGTGAIADAHAEAIAAQGGRAAVVACADVNPDRAATFASRWGIPTVYASVEEALASESLDLVHVCTPPVAHLAVAAAALGAGVIPIVEKPPVRSLEELEELARLERSTGVPVVSVFQQRFGSGAVRLRRLLAEGTLGRPLLAHCHTLWYRDADYFAVPWRGRWDTEGGGPTMGHGVHQFDLLLSVLGPWRELVAVAGRQSRDTETEDVSTAIVTFESGTIATIVNSVVSPRETSSLRFDFEYGSVELDHLYGYGDADWRVTGLPDDQSVQLAWDDGEPEVRSGHVAQFAAVLDALDRGERPPVDLDEARSTMELIAAIYASSFTGRRITRGELAPTDPFFSSMLGSGAPWLETVTR
ncbi:MAG TPA: Gfo/Idh/MocA family oxidoreductase [Plantibacter sp.]|uniref:Gfo/Idh/MocA family protein n=1 Tax=unclassified Plantibacter TaxID=2624265 RepID=UPI002BBD9F6A|nr:Gfo/Idh/MocA family oxidoreductase [Plantibacter sp.]